MVCRMLDLIIGSDFYKTCATSNNRVKRKRMQKNKLILLFLLNKQNVNKFIPKIDNYVCIIRNFSDEVFYSHFRMHRNIFQKLHDVLETSWNNKTGHPLTILEERLYITIWALANQNCFRELSDRFNKSTSTIHAIFVTTCKAIISNLTKKYVKWPLTVEEINRTVQDFNNLRQGLQRGFPNVIGCIDGTHIKIKAPFEDAISYYNRKGFHSILIQAVVKSDGTFSNVFCGWPGSSHDANLFKNSPLGIALINGDICLPPDIHLIGDSAYPLMEFLMVPYKDNGNLSCSQKKYNKELSSTRVVIEQAFGVLKKKFRVLNSMNFTRISNMKYVILACVTLYNFIMIEDRETIRDEELENSENEYDNYINNDHIHENEAIQKRDMICNLISS